MAVIVREQALDKQEGPRSSRVIEVLHKVVGVADLYAWGLGGRIFQEVHPKTVKNLVANDPNAKKDVVAASLPQFIGEYEYECDDESDAVAVGIAWLIQNHMVDSPYPPPEKKKTTRKKKETSPLNIYWLLL